MLNKKYRAWGFVITLSAVGCILLIAAVLALTGVVDLPPQLIIALFVFGTVSLIMSLDFSLFFCEVRKDRIAVCQQIVSTDKKLRSRIRKREFLFEHITEIIVIANKAVYIKLSDGNTVGFSIMELSKRNRKEVVDLIRNISEDYSILKNIDG